MGLFGSDDTSPATTAAEPDGQLDKVANAFIGRLMDLGIDGVGPVDSVAQVVAKARRKHGADVESAVAEIVRDHVKLAGVAGFATGVGGVVTMPVSLPANVVGFYALATRMVASVAILRGYDISTPGARAAITLALVGADADDLISKAGLSAANLTGSGRIARLAVSRMPKAAAMMVNKAVAFRLLTTVGGKALSRFVRFVPVAGGIVGAGLDGLLMKRLADHARQEFTPRAAGEVVRDAVEA
ncbi:EcsC family protein [Ornithinimicrobium cerasi]|uniref:EcsC protein family protein n=1 Tax=Ornithinimicrobium cerasi TaxID=2248773 RepID=A0A285VD63_9MICO|nr:EcsC family protein [Ornithinimicrobium cerasi]SOC52039.1 EcsC protein family protein [Ornithinimicrobium cerasi]